jgi:phospholipid/cholesterol/gamma-HCH transport system ATP-binding protein
MIQVEELHKTFGSHQVLCGASLKVPKGEFVALIGLSGSGKSSLLKQIVGLTSPDSGKVLVDGQDISRLSHKELQQLRSRIGYVFQNCALFDSLTVFENVAFPLLEKTRLPESQVRQRVMGTLEEVGLSGAVDKHPSQLSGGMMKRVALARTLVQEPEIVLFDEPTTGLDPIVANSILQLFDSVHRRFNLTGILVSHDIPKIFEIVQTVAMLHQGKVVAVEAAEGIAATQNPILAQFIQGTPEGPIELP